MFTFTLTRETLSADERAVFGEYLERQGLDDAIWPVYEAAMHAPDARAGASRSEPCVARAYADGKLVGAAIVVRCRAWAQAVFASPWLHRPLDALGLPAIIWLRVGFCAEGLANPGFVSPAIALDALVPPLIAFLKSQAAGLIVVDRAEDAPLHNAVRAYPYVKDSAVDLAGIHRIDDYLAAHRNIKRKIKEFENKGGRIDVTEGALDEASIARFRHCMGATVANSLVYSPFQDIFLDLVSGSCRIASERMIHFIARMPSAGAHAIVGYHTFVRAGRGLRMVHGAFDRALPTTRHSYENLILAAVRYATEQGLDAVHFGPIMNETKRRMMNATERVSLRFYSRHAVIRAAFALAFPFSRMQRKALLAFAR